ncbi:hypothetical protein AGR4A_pAt10019 [Agrobacterium tumefaciens str. B6]|uniref:Uncharacterized protein n=1 Tax=Agrobacterium tumefaciens str. B6 TaxID=1183423 RepID=A0A822VCS5_AGRTU|nr:hypothetical protein AGR4A_pAt10019 [Agrobacterium tumefaciens str. B6]
MQSRLAGLEPGFRDLAVLDLVDADHVDFPLSLRKGSRDGFVIDHDIPYNDTCEQFAVQIRLFEPLDVTRSYVRSACSKQSGWESVILAVVCPPTHERVNVPRIVSLKLFLDR